MVTSEPSAQRWARLRKDVQCQLRRGAWYPVLRLGPDDVVVRVIDAALGIPRTYLEVTDVRPSRWTVVPRRDDDELLPEGWGQFYAVCPNCATRAAVGRPSDTKRCTLCEQSFEVAWDERYLQ